MGEIMGQRTIRAKGGSTLRKTSATGGREDIGKRRPARKSWGGGYDFRNDSSVKGGGRTRRRQFGLEKRPSKNKNKRNRKKKKSLLYQ